MKLESTILIPTPNADPIIDQWRQKYDSSLKGIPAHVTLLHPFKSPDQITEEDLSMLAEFFQKVPSFEFKLYEIRSFPSVLFLEPSPRDVFIRLAEQLVEIYPDYPPFGGEFPEINPHATIANVASSDELEKIREEITSDVKPKLPINQKATEAWLMTEKKDGKWVVRNKFSFNN